MFRITILYKPLQNDTFLTKVKYLFFWTALNTAEMLSTFATALHWDQQAVELVF
jgi:hypothetical protein